MKATHRFPYSAALFGFLFGMLSCGGGETRQVVVVNLQYTAPQMRPSNVGIVGVDTSLDDGAKKSRANTVKQTLDQFGVEFQMGQKGHVMIDVYAYTGDQPCILAEGHGELDLAGSMPQTLTVNMNVKDSQACAMQVGPADLPKDASVWGTSPNDFWLAGEAGKIFRWNGSIFTRQPLPYSDKSPNWRSITGTNNGNVWIVGDGGAVLHTKGMGFEEVKSYIDSQFVVPSPVTNWESVTIARLPGQTVGDVYMVGNNFTLGYWRSGSGPQQMSRAMNECPTLSTLSSTNLHGVYGVSDKEILFVGDAGVIVDGVFTNGPICEGGNNPYTQVKPTFAINNNLRSVHAEYEMSRMNVHIVGDGAFALYSYRLSMGQPFQFLPTMAPVPGAAYLSVGGTGQNTDLWVVGEKGTILKWDFRKPQGELLAQPSASGNLHSISSTANQGVLFAGSDGALIFTRLN